MKEVSETMVSMASMASKRFTENQKDIQMLWVFRKELQKHPIKDSRLEVLHRAAVVFIAACWESYVEDVAGESFDYLLARSTTPDTIPTRVKVLASRELFEEKDARRIWELVTSWKEVLQSHRADILTRSLKGFNTPKTRQVRDLFLELLDLDVTSNWMWSDMTAEQATAALDQYMAIRGNIAHRTRHVDSIEKQTAKRFLAHVAMLVNKTDETIQKHLHALTGASPW